MSFDDHLDDAGDMNPGYLELAGGWCIPKDQMPGWPFDRLLTPIRGGMKYPTPTLTDDLIRQQEQDELEERLSSVLITGYPGKGHRHDKLMSERKDVTTMGQSMKAKLEQERQKASELIDSLEQRILDIDDQLAKAAPAVPPTAYHRYSMEIKFAAHGRKYEFLLLRKDGQWFTTGTSPLTKRFDNWQELVTWLNGPDVYWYSEMRVLYKGTEIYSFAEGTVITDPTGSEPPF